MGRTDNRAGRRLVAELKQDRNTENKRCNHQSALPPLNINSSSHTPPPLAYLRLATWLPGGATSIRAQTSPSVAHPLVRQTIPQWSMPPVTCSLHSSTQYCRYKASSKSGEFLAALVDAVENRKFHDKAKKVIHLSMLPGTFPVKSLFLGQEIHMVSGSSC